VQNNHFRALI